MTPTTGAIGTAATKITVPPARTGHVARLMRDRGFGFIRADDQREYFFHRNSLVGGLVYEGLVDGREGVPTRVRFDIEKDGAKGPRAVNVEAE